MEFTDAAASVGYGAFFQGKWVQGRWPAGILEDPPSIAFLEFCPLLVAVLCWAPLLSNRRVKFRSDNSAVVHIINSQTSQCDRLMHLVRLFVLECLRFNIVFKVVHIPGVANDLADSLSRFQMGRFWGRSAGRGAGNDATSGTPDHLVAGEICRLLSVAFAKNSFRTYSTGWHAFCQFTRVRFEVPTLPVHSTVIHEFIAWLSLRGLAPSTIARYVAGVGFYHKLHGHPDTTNDFVVSKLLEGCRRDRRNFDQRTPITVPILIRILGALPLFVHPVLRSCYLEQLCCVRFLVS